MKIKRIFNQIKIKVALTLLKSAQIKDNECVKYLQTLDKKQKKSNFWHTKLDKMCYNIDKDEKNGKRGMDTMFTIFDIANWFLSKESMTHKKLQKLCYYAQAWLYVFECNKVSTDYEAWVHGPVNRTLWNRFKSFGYNRIPCNELKNVATDINDSDVLNVLDSVWETYGEFTDFELENLTHTETPWIEAREGCDKFEPSSNLISKSTMKNYYSGLFYQEGISE